MRLNRSIQFTLLSSIFRDSIKPSINRFDDTLPDPSRTPTPTVTPSLGAFTLDFDYAVLKYTWQTPNGTDLDTRTSLSEVERQNIVGWSRLPNDEDYLIWGRDNQAPIGTESVLINFNRIKQDFPDTQDIRFSLRAFWYTSKFDGNVKLSFTTYKGGTMQRVGTEFVNYRGQLVAEITADVNVPTVQSSDIDGDDVADLVFDTVLNRGAFQVKIPAVTPTPTLTPTNTRTPTSTATFTPTRTRTITPTPSNGASPTPTPSFTPTISLTPTITPTISVTPTITPTITLSPTTSVTPSVGASPTSIPPSRTAEPTFTPTRTPVVSITATSTPIPPTPTPTNTPTRTVTPTITITPSPTRSASITPSVTPTIGSSPTPTLTPTLSATISITPTATRTTTPQPTVSRSITPSNTPDPSKSATPNPTSSLTPTISVTPSLSNTPTMTPTMTPTVTVSPSLTVTPTPSGIITTVQGEQVFAESGVFTVPPDVFSVHVVAVGGTLQVQGDNPTPSTFGNIFNSNTPLGQVINGSVVGGGNGGLGGRVSSGSSSGSGGGGAGGYVGDGGAGADRASTEQAPSGSGGGGGGGSAGRGGNMVGGVGGGVYLYGINLDNTPSGAGGQYPSNIQPGNSGQPGGIPIGQAYGQGWVLILSGGARQATNGGNLRFLNNISVTPGQTIPISIFRNGAVRVVWGQGREFPYNASDLILPTPTPTVTPTMTSTVTPTLTRTVTPTMTSTVTPTLTRTNTVTPTATATVTPTMTPTVSTSSTIIPQHFLRFEGPEGTATFTDDGGSVWQVASGSPTISSAAFGIEQRGLQLNGSSSIRTLTPVDLRGRDFTLEAWIRPSTLSSGGSNGVLILSKWENEGFNFFINQNGSIGFSYAPFSTSATFITSSAGVIVANVWTHVAVTRTGSVFRLFVNGNIVADATFAGEMTTNTRPYYIGTYTISGSERLWNFTGSMENVRIITQSLYTSNFIPSPPVTPTPTPSVTRTITPTATATRTPTPTVTPTRTPPPSVTPTPSVGAQLPQSLMFFEGANGSTTFTDETGKIWNRAAGSTTSISTTTAAGGNSSLLVDGNTGIIGTDSSISDFTFNADFTVEMFVRQSALQSGNRILFINCRDSTPATGICLYMLNGTSSVAVYDYVANNIALTSSIPLVIGQWTHVALSRVSGTIRLFINGQLAGTVSRSSAYVAAADSVAIGGARSGSFGPGVNYAVFSGNIDSFRVFNTVGIYQAAFTPPNPNNFT